MTHEGVLAARAFGPRDLRQVVIVSVHRIGGDGTQFGHVFAAGIDVHLSNRQVVTTLVMHAAAWFNFAQARSRQAHVAALHAPRGVLLNGALGVGNVGVQMVHDSNGLVELGLARTLNLEADRGALPGNKAVVCRVDFHRIDRALLAEIDLNPGGCVGSLGVLRAIGAVRRAGRGRHPLAGWHGHHAFIGRNIRRCGNRRGALEEARARHGGTCSSRSFQKAASGDSHVSLLAISNDQFQRDYGQAINVPIVPVPRRENVNFLRGLGLRAGRWRLRASSPSDSNNAVLPVVRRKCLRSMFSSK